MDRLLVWQKNSLQYGNSMCPSMIRKLIVIVYFRKVFLLSKFKYFCSVTILDMSSQESEVLSIIRYRGTSKIAGQLVPLYLIIDRTSDSCDVERRNFLSVLHRMKNSVCSSSYEEQTENFFGILISTRLVMSLILRSCNY